MFYLTTHSTHFILRLYGVTHMVKDRSLRKGIKSFLVSQVCFKPLLDLEPMAPIRPQLLVSHANHSATETLCIYVYMYVCLFVCMYVCMHVCTYVYMYVCMYVGR